MVRYHIKEGNHLRISYGHEETIGLFLNVWDATGMLHSDSTEFLHRKIFYENGSYCLQLHTGFSASGYKVDKDIILDFMKKFGVKSKHLMELSYY